MLFEWIKALLQRIRLSHQSRRLDYVLPSEKAAPNRKFVGNYSDEEIARGQGRMTAIAVQTQLKNDKAQARWKDAEQKLGMRPGIDGFRAPFRSGPA